MTPEDVPYAEGYLTERLSSDEGKTLHALLAYYKEAGTVKEQLAVIRKPQFGIDDHGKLSLRFEAYISEGEAATQRISEPEILIKAFKEANIHLTEEFEGKLCWVEVQNFKIVYLRMWKAT